MRCYDGMRASKRDLSAIATCGITSLQTTHAAIALGTPHGSAFKASCECAKGASHVEA